MGKIKPVYYVGLFLLVMLFGFCREAKADEVSVEIGPTFLSAEFAKGGTLILSERFDKYSVGMGVVSKQTVIDSSGDKYTPRQNLFVQAQRHVNITDSIDMGIGLAYFNATHRALGSNFTAALSLTYEVTDSFSIRYRHWSNAGSASPNMGQDAITIVYHFGEHR